MPLERTRHAREILSLDTRFTETFPGTPLLSTRDALLTVSTLFSRSVHFVISIFQFAPD